MMEKNVETLVCINVQAITTYYNFLWGPRGGGGEGVQGAKLFADCKLIGAPAPNQYQLITFLTLKTDKIAKLRIELKSILLEIPSNKIKIHILNWYICDLVFTVSHRHRRKMWVDYWGGPKGMCPPPTPNYWRGGGGGASPHLFL